MNIKDAVSESMAKKLSKHHCKIGFIDANIIVLIRGELAKPFDGDAIADLESIFNSTACMYENEGKTISLRFNEGEE